MTTETTDSTGQEVFRDGDYWLAADGKVYRGDEHIGTRDELGVVAYAEGMAKYKNRVGRLLNAVAIASDAGGLPTPKEPEEGPEGPEEGPVALSTHSSGIGSWPPEQSQVPGEDGGGGGSGSVVIPSDGPGGGGPGGGGYPPYDETPPPSSVAPAEPPKPEEEKPPYKCKDKELTFEQIRGDYPDGSPACDWRGDLTPEFVEWYFEHYPERAKQRYETRALLPVIQDVLVKLQLSIY